MKNCFIESYDNVLNEDDVNSIVNLMNANGIDTQCKIKKRGIMNAAIDDLVAQVIMFFNSDWITALANFTTISMSIVTAVGIIKNRIKQKDLKKISLNQTEDEKPNIIIRIDNITILNPKTDIVDLEKYYKDSLIITKDILENKIQNEMIVEYDMQTKKPILYTIEEYAKKCMNEKEF